MATTDKKSFAASIFDTIKTVFYALLIAGLFRTLFFQPFWIPSGSMKDTLLIGDFLFVNKMAYGYSYASCPKIQISQFGINLDADDFCWFLKDRGTRILSEQPKRGDVVVFRHPISGTDYIKRVIGLPGDRIQMKASKLYINEVPVKTKRTEDFIEIYARQGSMGNRPICANGVVGLGGDCIKKKYTETLPNGLSYGILDAIDQDDLKLGRRGDLLGILAQQDNIANITKDVCGIVLGREMDIPNTLQADFIGYVKSAIETCEKARKAIEELDELLETGFTGQEVKFVKKLIRELDAQEQKVDKKERKLRHRLFKIEAEIPPVKVMFLYNVIDNIGEVADVAEQIGNQLELLLAK